MDFVNAIQPISKTYFVLYMKQANNTKKALSLKYHKVVIKLREAFQNLFKSHTIIKGNAFNVDFTGEFEEDIFITTKVQKGKGNSLFYS